MDKSAHKQNFGAFLSTLYQGNNINVMPCQGFDTQEPKGNSLQRLVQEHNNHLPQSTVISVHNLKGAQNKIQMGDCQTAIADELIAKATIDGNAIISSVSQIN